MSVGEGTGTAEEYRLEERKENWHQQRASKSTVLDGNRSKVLVFHSQLNHPKSKKTQRWIGSVSHTDSTALPDTGNRKCWVLLKPCDIDLM